MSNDDLREQYLSYSQSLQTANNKTQEELDKSLITLCTVLIGVALTVRQQVSATNSGFGFPVSLWATIILLLLSILTVLLSHFLSLWVNQSIIDAIDNEKDLDGPYSKTRFVKMANYFSAGLFFVGLLTAVLFAFRAANGVLPS